MGCTGSTNSIPPNDGKRPLKVLHIDDVNGITSDDEPRSPVAFIIPLDDKEESLVKRQPPKRFHEEQLNSTPTITHKMLLNKQAEAEQRRLQILKERVESAKKLMKPRTISNEIIES